MLALRELQAAFADQLTGRNRADLVAHVKGEGVSAAARLAVHRNHLGESLTNALAGTFPTVRTLVGEEFFARLSRDFLAVCLPAQPVLAEYGAELPSFIAAYDPASGLPYLADMARLDWALNVAFYNEPVRRLTVADLAAVAAEHLPAHRLALPPAACVIDSPYPLQQIWQASQPGAGEDRVDLKAGSCRLLVLPGTPSSYFAALSEAETAFVLALAGGETLEKAAGAGFAVDPGFALSKSFARLVDLGAFAALR